MVRRSAASALAGVLLLIVLLAATAAGVEARIPRECSITVTKLSDCQKICTVKNTGCWHYPHKSIVACGFTGRDYFVCRCSPSKFKYVKRDPKTFQVTYCSNTPPP